MGQYFMWLNPIKGEYIEPFDFDQGSKRRESAWVGSAILDSLYTLMANDWKGDPIVWIGDYVELNNEKNSTLMITEKICGPSPYEYANLHFKDVSCQFSNCSKKDVVEGVFHKEVLMTYGMSEDEINHYFVKCRSYDEPCESPLYECEPPSLEWDFQDYIQYMIAYLENKGMFSRKAEKFHLLINDTKKEFVDFRPIISESEKKYNPFPVLMIKENNSKDPTNDLASEYCGIWLGDTIRVSNDICEVPTNYMDASNKYSWEEDI